MNRQIDIVNDFDLLNQWVQRSINYFNNQNYIDDISEVYNYGVAEPQRIESGLRRRILSTHNDRNDEELITLLKELNKFPYDEPFWYLLQEIDGFIENNPNQVNRIAQSLYNMSGEELLAKIESSPKLNQQTGPMFNNWLVNEFNVLNIEDFIQSEQGIHVLGGSEIEAKNFLEDQLNQNVDKRPDLVAKVNTTYIIAEAKWVGRSGGNQDKSVDEVLNFCSNVRENVLRIGIIDGFVWMTRTSSGRLTNLKSCVKVQETHFNLMSALILEDYFNSLL